MNKNSDRVEYIDALRGFIMFLVVYHHVAYWGMDDLDLGYNESFRKFLMPTFFFISGWLFYTNNRSWDKMTILCIIKKKFMKLIIPFLFFMLLYMYQFNGPEYQTTFDSKYGFWYIYSLFQFYIIYIVIEVVFNKEQSNKIEAGIIFFILALSIFSFCYEIFRFEYDLGIWRKILTALSFSKIKFIIYFWLGTFAKKNYTSFIRLTDNKYVIAFCLGVFYLLAIHSSQIYHSNIIELRTISFLLTGTTGCIFVYTLFRKNEVHFSKDTKIGKALQYIGQRSLDIYLLHYFVLPYHLPYISTWIAELNSKTVEMLIILILSLWILSLSLLLSCIIRLSPFLGHYLFGAK